MSYHEFMTAAHRVYPLCQSVYKTSLLNDLQSRKTMGTGKHIDVME